MAKKRPRKADGAQEIAIPPPPALTERPKSLVFISHDSRDAELAEAFANLLSDVSGGTLKSFRSSDKRDGSGIGFGAEWYTSIMSQLGDATDVVALLTARSVDRPWILYEAGVAKGKLNTVVLGLAVGVPLEKVSTGPFGQFQNCAADEDSLTKLVIQLLRRNPDAAPREEAVRNQVRLFITTIEKIPQTETKRTKGKGESDDENAAKLFEEVKAMVRELQEKLERPSRMSAGIAVNSGRLRLTYDVLNGTLSRAFSIDPKKRPHEAATTLLLLLSLVRDAAPWALEPGMELYRALKKRDGRAIAQARDTISTIADFVMDSRWYQGIRPFGDRNVYAIIRDFPRILTSLANKYASTIARKAEVEQSELKM